MAQPIPMFDQPPPARRVLSQRYAAMPYRVSVSGGRPRWTPVRLKRPIPCDECFANQHESGGASGVRADAHLQRWLGTAVLKLCHGHAQLWRERDEADQ